MTFIIDFDHTLFNTSLFKKDLARSVKKFGINERLWLQTYQKIVSRVKKAFDYDVKLHSQWLAQKAKVPSFLIEKEFRKILKKNYKYLYPDSKLFLRYLKNKKAKVILLTLGNIKWQKEKIKNLGIKKYFQRIIFTYWHKKYIKLNFNNSSKNLIFINDNLKEIKELKKLFPNSLFFRIKRKGIKNVCQKNERIKILTFPNLIEIKRYLQTNLFKKKQN